MTLSSEVRLLQPGGDQAQLQSDRRLPVVAEHEAERRELRGASARPVRWRPPCPGPRSRRFWQPRRQRTLFLATWQATHLDLTRLLTSLMRHTTIALLHCRPSSAKTQGAAALTVDRPELTSDVSAASLTTATARPPSSPSPSPQSPARRTGRAAACRAAPAWRRGRRRRRPARCGRRAPSRRRSSWAARRA